jgi:3-oxoacyl-(acyl-carrier-protein) synthase
MDAVGRAHRLIQAGRADVILAGGAEAPISPLVVGSFDQIKATASRFNQTPARASRPFDRERDGFVLGEGAAVLVLEELEHARRRGARVYAEIAGYACRTNAYHMTGLKADGAELEVTIRASLDEARIAPAQVDFVAAHGTGTRQNDRHETAAFKLVLERRAHEIPINSIKSTIGYALGAAGALQLAGAILAMTHGVVPPTINLEHPDPECDLDYTAMTARDHRVGITLATASGFGGLQAATVLARPSEGE